MVIRRSAVVIAGIIMILIASITALYYASKLVLNISIPLKNAEAIILLAGSYEERAPVAASLYHAGYGRCILLTNDGVRKGWSREHQRNVSSIELSAENLIRRGVPQPVIISLPFRKSGTVYDALVVREYIRTHNIRSVLLVTSDFHTRRSLWIFQLLLKKLPITIGVVATPTKFSGIPEITLEYLKFAYYIIRFGWLGDIPNVSFSVNK